MFALTELKLRQDENSKWYINLGAVAHVTGHGGKIFQLVPYFGRGGIVMGDETHHVIS